MTFVAFETFITPHMTHASHPPMNITLQQPKISLFQAMFAQNHIFSLAPKSLNTLEKSRDVDFDFWVPSKMRNHHSRNCDPDSPTLWKRENMSVSVAKDVDTSPLLPQDHHYSNLSPSSRTRRIEEGRREMMEMIQNLPESSFELSLKDIVDEQQSLKESQKEEEGKFELPTAGAESDKNQKRKKRKEVTRTTSHQHHQVSRCNSLETGTFLIKMFFPSFLASNKKPATSRNSRSKISPRTSFEGPDQRNPDMMLRIKMSPVAKDQGSRDRVRTENGTSRSKSYSSRNNDSDAFLGCWPFAGPKGKMQRQRTCVF